MIGKIKTTLKDQEKSKTSSMSMGYGTASSKTVDPNAADGFEAKLREAFDLYDLDKQGAIGRWVGLGLALGGWGWGQGLEELGTVSMGYSTSQ